jgi:trk system potassium uptake protein TrkA
MEKRHFCGGEGIIFNRKIQPLCSLIGQPIQTGYQGLGLLLIERQGKLLIVNEQMLLDAHDTLFFIITAEKEKEAEQWIGSL